MCVNIMKLLNWSRIGYISYDTVYGGPLATSMKNVVEGADLTDRPDRNINSTIKCALIFAPGVQR